MASYHALWFIGTFFTFLAIAFVLILPLVILQIIKLFRPGIRKPIVLQVIVGICTTLSCIAFGCMLIVVSVFSYYPYYAAALLITLFLILIFIAFRPWKPGFFKSKANIYLIVLLIFMFIIAWIVAALTRDVCIATQPTSVSVWQTRRTRGDACAKDAPKPCHVYVTWGANASTTAIVHFHASKHYKEPVVHYSPDASFSWSVNATTYEMELEVDRWVYYAEISNMTAGETYRFIAGDNADDESYSPVKMIRAAPSSGSFSFVTGGDVGLEDYASPFLKAAATHEPLYIALGGDIAYENGMSSCYPRWDDWLDMYERDAVTPTGYTIPILTAVGNHEAGGFERPLSSLKFFSRYFVQESLNGRQPHQLPTYHAHQIANQVMVALDSEVISSAKSQVPFLNETLSAAPEGSFKTAIYHAPGYPAYRPFNQPVSKAIRDHFVPVFDRYQLAVSFENHDHVYKRTHRLKGGSLDPTGTLYVGDGAMGVHSREPPRQLPIPSDRPFLQQWQGRSFYLLVSVTDSSYNVTAINQDAMTFDTFGNSYP